MVHINFIGQHFNSKPVVETLVEQFGLYLREHSFSHEINHEKLKGPFLKISDMIFLNSAYVKVYSPLNKTINIVVKFNSTDEVVKDIKEAFGSDFIECAHDAYSIQRTITELTLYCLKEKHLINIWDEF